MPGGKYRNSAVPGERRMPQSFSVACPELPARQNLTRDRCFVDKQIIGL